MGNQAKNTGTNEQGKKAGHDQQLDHTEKLLLEKQIEQMHNQEKKTTESLKSVYRSIRNEYRQTIERELGPNAHNAILQLKVQQKIARAEGKVNQQQAKEEMIAFLRKAGIDFGKLSKIRQDFANRAKKESLVAEGLLSNTPGGHGGGVGNWIRVGSVKPVLSLMDQSVTNEPTGEGHLFDNLNIRPYDNERGHERDIYNDFTFFNMDAGDFDFVVYISHLRVGAMVPVKAGERVTIEAFVTCDRTHFYSKLYDEAGWSGIAPRFNTCGTITAGSDVLLSQPLWGVDINTLPYPYVQYDSGMNVDPLQPGQGATLAASLRIPTGSAGTSNDALQSIPIWVGINEIMIFTIDDYSVIVNSINRWKIRGLHVTREKLRAT